MVSFQNAGFLARTGITASAKSSYSQAMVSVHRRWAAKLTLVAASVPLLVYGVQVKLWAKEDPHRPICSNADCRKIRSFLKARYCGEAPFGNGPSDGCNIRNWKPSQINIKVIAGFDCDYDREVPCRQDGQPPSKVRTTLIEELRRLGLPAGDEKGTVFKVWNSNSSGWSLAEGYYSHRVGPRLTLCQVIVMIDPKSGAIFLRQLPFQVVDADVPLATIWSVLDLVDVDGDGQPEAILRGDAYENHWLEVYGVLNGSPHMIFSGLGYYL